MPCVTLCTQANLNINGQILKKYNYHFEKNPIIPKTTRISVIIINQKL